MLAPVKVVDLELAGPAEDLEGLDGYMGVQALVRLHGTPLGYVRAPVTAGRCPAAVLRQNAVESYREDILRHLIEDGLAAPAGLSSFRAAEIAAVRHPDPPRDLPSVTIAVCTRDRPEDLRVCLAALSRLGGPAVDVLVVDNAPRTSATRDIVEREFPSVRYALEPRPGLDWARNRALEEATGEIVAYTDDDVVVDSGWTREIAATFAQEPGIDAVTGLVVPYELETEVQLLFEQDRGFGRGFRRRVFRLRGRREERLWSYGTGQCGTGANMAFRREVLARIGGFDPALDVGTVTNGGGDLEIFYRLQKEGFTLLYQPAAVVRHRHRRDLDGLRRQIEGNGLGLYSHFSAVARRYPEERAGVIRFGVWWLSKWSVRRWIRSLLYPQRFPRSLIAAELMASIRGLGSYQRARRTARDLRTGADPPADGHSAERSRPAPPSKGRSEDPGRIAVRTVDLSRPVQALTGLNGADRARIFVLSGGEPIGVIEADAEGIIAAPAIRAQMAAELGTGLLKASGGRGSALLWAEAMTGISRWLAAEADALASSRPRLPDFIPVSVVIATLDRPDDLRNCLRSLVDQIHERPVEVVVVDNHPASGKTPPVVREFPGVVLVDEPRRGLAYARNKGFTSARGEVLVATDDDVVLPEGWLDEVVAPFARADVGAVTGHVLPLELDTAAQRSFEAYGGLGRGFRPFQVDRDWFDNCSPHPPPTWTLGATANAAFRRSALAHPEVGLMDEALGPGTPTGVGEDTYLFYRLLKAGYTIVYEPRAYLWHRHRRELHNVRKQLYAYSKGHVAYHLTTLLRDGDFRALTQLFYNLPVSYYLKELVRQLRGRGRYPFDLLLAQMAGSVVGPVALWQSRRRVRREGRSDPLQPSPPLPAGLGEASLSDAVPTASRTPAAPPGADQAADPAPLKI